MTTWAAPSRDKGQAPTHSRASIERQLGWEPVSDPEWFELSDARRIRVTHQHWRDTEFAVIDSYRLSGPKGLSIISSHDETPHGVLHHVSVAYPEHLPSWRDLRVIKDFFFGPDVAAAIILPEEAYYVNQHPNCLHLWEIPEGWKFNATV